MPVVPTAERRVSPQTTQVSTPSVGGSISGAFGEEVAQAQTGLGEAGVRAGTALIERMNRIAYQRNKWQNEAKVANLAGQYFSDTLDMMHNNNTKTINRDGKDYDIEDGILDRSGYSMAGGTNEYVQREAVLRKSLLDQIEDPEYKAKLEQKILSHFLSRKESLINYEAAQLKAADVKEFESLNKNLIASASISSDPAILSGTIAELEDNNSKIADRLDLDEQTQKLITDADIVAAVDNAVMTSLKSTASLEVAQGLLDSVKDKITEKDYQNLGDQLRAYDRQRKSEARTEKSIFQHTRGSGILDTYMLELDKPLAERTITPQFLREEHVAGNINDGLFTSLTNNILGEEETRVKAGEAEVKAEKLKAKNAEESRLQTLLRKHQLTEDIVNASADREKDPLDAGFALTMIAAVKSQAAKGIEPTAAEKDEAYIEFTNRAVGIEESGASLDELAKFQVDVIEAHTKRLIDPSDAQKWLKDIQGDLDDDLNLTVKTIMNKARPRKFLEALWNWTDKFARERYETEALKPGVKARLTRDLMDRIRNGEDPHTALDMVINEETEAMNPNKLQYKLGQIVPSPSGASGEVVGFNERGVPIIGKISRGKPSPNTTK